MTADFVTFRKALVKELWASSSGVSSRQAMVGSDNSEYMSELSNIYHAICLAIRIIESDSVKDFKSLLEALQKANLCPQAYYNGYPGELEALILRDKIIGLVQKEEMFEPGALKV